MVWAQGKRFDLPVGNGVAFFIIKQILLLNYRNFNSEQKTFSYKQICKATMMGVSYH